MVMWVVVSQPSAMGVFVVLVELVVIRYISGQGGVVGGGMGGVST